MRRISVVFVLIIILTSVVSGFNTSSELYAREENDVNYNIKLKSRTVVPDDDLNPDVINRLQKIPYSRVHVLLSLDHIPNPFEKIQLEENGVKLLAYIPDNGWFASVPKDRLDLVVSLPIIRWLGEILPEDKLGMSVKSREFGDWSYNPESNSVRLIVQLFEDVPVERGGYYRIIESYGAKVLEEIPVINSILIEIPVSNIDSLSEEDLVQWIEEIPGKPELTNKEIRDIIKADIVYDPPYEFKGTGVVIAIFETGVPDASHIEFDRDMKMLAYVNDSEVVDSRISYGDPVFMMESNEYVGEKSKNQMLNELNLSNETVVLTQTKYGWVYWYASEHATHVAGTAIGKSGVATNATMVAYALPKVVLKYGYSDEEDAAKYESLAILSLYKKYLSAINDYGARISTNSWGFKYNIPPNGTLSQLYDKLITSNLISIVAAAGNESNYMSLRMPNDSKNTIIVGSIQDDGSFKRSNFSSRGPTVDGRIKPDVTAPGCNINSAYTTATHHIVSNYHEVYADEVNVKQHYYDHYKYKEKCGTSMSTPAVAGSLALILEAYELNNSEQPLPSTLKAILIHTAVDLDRSGNGEITFDGPDLQNGWGLINVFDAIELVLKNTYNKSALQQKSTDPKIIENVIGYPEVDTLNIEGIDSEKLMMEKYSNIHSYNIDLPKDIIELKVTLVWDDATGVLNAAKALQNDLDVYIIDPSGNKYLPWILDVSNCDPKSPDVNDCYSKPATKGIDQINNVEQVIADSSSGLQEGEWRIMVKGSAVPIPVQKYSLIITSKPSNTHSTVTYTTVSTQSIPEVTITLEETSTTISQISDPTITTADVATLTPTPASQESGGGGCLIATAAFGSELSPQIQFLRGFRDQKIMSTEAGANFMKVFNQFYYSFSPQIAEYERSNPVFKNIVKYSIYPLLGILQISETGYNIAGSSELGAIFSGFIAAMLIGVIYLSPFILIIKHIRQGKTLFKKTTLLLLVSLSTLIIGIINSDPTILMITTSFFILTTIIGFSVLTPKILVSVYKKYLVY